MSGVMIEIEIKLPMTGRDEALARLARLPAALEEAPRFEDNEIFDTPDGAFVSEGKLLRLRVVDGHGVLTYKERVESPLKAKVRREVQSEVASPDAMRAILLATGLRRVWRYQKHRSYYHWSDPAGAGALAISLDETPIGVFVELEGPKGAIDAAAARMGFTEADYEVADYHSLHDAWLAARGLPPADMTFPDQERRP